MFEQIARLPLDRQVGRATVQHLRTASGSDKPLGGCGGKLGWGQYL